MSEKLSDQEIASRLSDLKGWKVSGGQLKKTFSFDQYLDGIDFARRCGELAEEMNHHPDLLIQWRKVTVSLVTHSAGGLTDLDFEFAKSC
jgi:4a-hydroxytetrahydrobiopterin dehydratase